MSVLIFLESFLEQPASCLVFCKQVRVLYAQVYVILLMSWRVIAPRVHLDWWREHLSWHRLKHSMSLWLRNYERNCPSDDRRRLGDWMHGGRGKNVIVVFLVINSSDGRDRGAVCELPLRRLHVSLIFIVEEVLDHLMKKVKVRGLSPSRFFFFV